MNAPSIYYDILLGVAVGDAMGVPVEFRSRQYLKQNPVMDMIGFGTYSLPPGTWSDDSSLTFCLAETLINGFSPELLAKNFVRWFDENYWTANENVFDVGIGTRQAIINLRACTKPELAGGFDETDNGNGSLMRILPLLTFMRNKTIEDRYFLTKQVSSVTHGHVRSVIACFYYLEFARELSETKDKVGTYHALQLSIPQFLAQLSINNSEVKRFDRLLNGDISILHEDTIESGGYVIHTLEASIWSLLTTNTFEEAILKGVNLGKDTDTIGAVTGGLAAILYGHDSIPDRWLHQIARRDDIMELALRLAIAMEPKDIDDIQLVGQH